MQSSSRIYGPTRWRFPRIDKRFAIERSVLKTLPIIDISGDSELGSLDDNRHIAHEIRKACINIGFFYLIGHEILPSEIEEIFAWGRRFFDLSMISKRRLSTSNGREESGYVAVGKSAAASDLKERLVLHSGALMNSFCDPEGRVRSSIDTALPGFFEFIGGQTPKREALSRTLQALLERSLHLQKRHFSCAFEPAMTTLAFNGYPPLRTSTETVSRTCSFSAHIDYGAFTILTQNAATCLEVENIAGEWIRVRPIPGALIVNLGDLMSRWTNDLYVSSRHRVRNLSNEFQVSVPFFVAPNGDSVISCLETCRDQIGSERYPRFSTRDYSRALIEDGPWD